MDNSFYTYNNEAFVFGVIQKILIQKKKINIGRLFIIVCFLLQDKLINNSNIHTFNTLKDFLNINSKKIVQFPRIYLELLPIIINALTLMIEADLIELDQCDIVSTSTENDVFNSNRLNNIENVLPYVLQLTEPLSEKRLYDLLNVKL